MQKALEQCVICPNSEAISCELAGETVILDMASGRYFALDPVGTRVWEWIQRSCTVASLCDWLQQEYDVDPALCRQDISILLEQLAAHGLVKLNDGHQV